MAYVEQGIGVNYFNPTECSRTDTFMEGRGEGVVGPGFGPRGKSK